MSSVAEFHRIFRHPIASSPELPDQKYREMRIRILSEEFEEYEDAEYTDDLIEVADALADIWYIACGTAVAYGLAVWEGHVRISGIPSLAKYQHGQGNRDEMRHALHRYRFAEASNDLSRIAGALQQVIDCAHAVAESYCIPLHDVFAEVHRSNMSKLGEDGQPIYREDGKVIKGPNYTPPDVRSVLFPKAA